MSKNILTFLLILAIAICIGCRTINLMQPKRVKRDHQTEVPSEFQYFAKTIPILKVPGEKWLSKAQVADDLDELEWLLENRFSYLQRKEVDYKATLDTIRISLEYRMKRSQLAWKINKVLALFGDGHTTVSDPVTNWICKEHLPFLVGQYQERYFAFKEDRSDFWDPNFPYITMIQHVPVAQWLDITKDAVPAGSEHYVRSQSIRNLRYYGIFARELGLPPVKSVPVQFTSKDGNNQKTTILSLVEKRPKYGSWPQRENQILQENIGYLRLAPFMDPRPEFLEKIIQNMNDFRDTKGLIIDIRGNGGGTRAPLKTLFPFFMKPDDLPYIVNISAYRHGMSRKDAKNRFTGRYLYSPVSSHWSKTENKIILRHLETFQPEWQLPEDQFSWWHYFVISPVSDDKRYYTYDQPVVILMDTRNFSACDIFLGAFKGWRNVTLLGTPSGGGSGSAKTYRLHYSDIAVKLSTMASFQPDGKLYEGRGIRPDIYMEPVPTDWIGQSDTLLDRARQIIEQKNR